MSIQAEIRIGSEFVGYRIDALIDRGGMGVVYRAHDLRLRRTVALKLMAPELALDRRYRERFSRESDLAMSLEHPNVVPIHDAGEVDGRLYLAMRLVEGTDLRALLRAAGALDPGRAIAICRQVANALDAAHGKGLVHRDVKPSNVLLDPTDHAYLADFGLTRRLDEQNGPTMQGRSIGTPAYLAPEQIEGGPIDGRADVYSLGCLLYECLTGETPFAGSRLEMSWAHLEEDPPSATARRAELPEAVDAVIRTAMAKEPDHRYATCGALVGAAEEALELRRPPALRRYKRLVAALTALLVLTVVLVAVLISSRHAGGGPAELAVTGNALARIDPTTNAVTNVVDVGFRPSAVAVGGRTVWVYNDAGPSISEIDSATAVVRHTTPLVSVPASPHGVTGPVLAADTAGAWIVGTDQHGRPYLTRVFSAPRGKREYRLEGAPTAVAVGYHAVWVVTRGPRQDEVVRMDPATGRGTHRTRFPASAQIDGLAAGLGGIWVVSSSRATLYRIDPHSGRVTGRLDLGNRAARPEVVFGSIWVGTERVGSLIVDPRTVSVIGTLSCCTALDDDDATGYDSIWSYDTPSGTVVRWDRTTHQPTANIQITKAPVYSCLVPTSIAAGAGAIWVTVADTSDFGC